MSVAQYGMYVWWRTRGESGVVSGRHVPNDLLGSRIPDHVFVGWMVVGTISAAYNCSWVSEFVDPPRRHRRLFDRISSWIGLCCDRELKVYGKTGDIPVDRYVLFLNIYLTTCHRGLIGQVYYFAMVTNLLIRFIFVWYVPQRASYTRLRSFFFALLEMLRRWQWNFCKPA